MTDDQAQLEQAIGYQDGFHAGWAAAAPTIQARDEWIARRIVALLLQHEYNQQLVASVVRTKPYAERGIPRSTAA